MTNCHFEVAIGNQDGLISNGNGPRIRQRRSSNAKVASKDKNSTAVKLTLNSWIEEKKVTITLPVKTVSELNCSDHWTKKHKRHKLQQRTVALVLNPVRDKIPVPCHIHLTRYAPGKLNKHDNLPASMKYIVDACCAIITGDFRPGRADDDERISFSYGQVETPHYGVKVEFTF